MKDSLTPELVENNPEAIPDFDLILHEPNPTIAAGWTFLHELFHTT